MAKTPATTTPRKFQPQLSESRPIIPSNEADAVARIAEVRRRRGRDAPPANGAAAPGARPEVDPAAALGVATAPYTPLTPFVQPQPAPGPVQPAATPGARAPQPQPTLPGTGMVEVLINGQMQPVTLDELRRGYMRQADYSTKTAQAAEQLRQAQSAHTAFDNARRTMEARLPQILAGFEDEFASPIDWVKLAREDPIGYAQKDARFKQYANAKQELQNLAELRAREDFNRKQEMRRLGHDFLAQVLPGWSDATTRQQLQALQVAHLQSVGYSADEIANYEALDPRQIVILEESRRFRVLAAMYPDLLRAPEMHPENPQARGVTPSVLPGNGLLSGREPNAMAEGEAQQNWENARQQGGRAATDAAVSLIAARRARRQGGG
jgi:hypothetical protein